MPRKRKGKRGGSKAAATSGSKSTAMTTAAHESKSDEEHPDYGNAVRHYDAALSRRVFGALVKYVREQQLQKALAASVAAHEARAVESDHNRLVKVTFATWKNFTKERVTMRAKEREAAERIAMEAAEQAQRELEAEAKALQAQKEAAVAVITKGVAKPRLQQGFQQWLAVTAAARHEEALDHAAVDHHKRHLMHKGLTAFVTNMAAMREQHEKEAAADALANRALMQRSLRAWHAVAEDSAAASATRRSVVSAGGSRCMLRSASMSHYESKYGDSASVSSSVRQREQFFKMLLAEKLAEWVRQPRNLPALRAAIEQTKVAYITARSSVVPSFLPSMVKDALKRERQDEITAAVSTIAKVGPLQTLVKLFGSDDWASASYTNSASLNTVLMEKLLEKYKLDLCDRLLSGHTLDSNDFVVYEGLMREAKVELKALCSAAAIPSMKLIEQQRVQEATVEAEEAVEPFAPEAVMAKMATGFREWVLNPVNRRKIALRLDQAACAYLGTTTGAQKRAADVARLQTALEETDAEEVLLISEMLTSGKWKEPGFIGLGLGCASFNTLAVRTLVERYIKDVGLALEASMGARSAAQEGALHAIHFVLGKSDLRDLFNIWHMVHSQGDATAQRAFLNANAKVIYDGSCLAKVTDDTLEAMRDKHFAGSDDEADCDTTVMGLGSGMHR